MSKARFVAGSIASIRVWALSSVAVSVAIAIAALMSTSGVQKHDKLYTELEQVRTLNESLRAENKRLVVETQALRSNPEYMEAVIRDELGWVRNDEIVLIFPPAKTAGDSNSAKSEAPPP